LLTRTFSIIIATSCRSQKETNDDYKTVRNQQEL